MPSRFVSTARSSSAAGASSLWPDCHSDCSSGSSGFACCSTLSCRQVSTACLKRQAWGPSFPEESFRTKKLFAAATAATAAGGSWI